MSAPNVVKFPHACTPAERARADLDKQIANTARFMAVYNRLKPADQAMIRDILQAMVDSRPQA